jgi:hypothetical protein
VIVLLPRYDLRSSIIHFGYFILIYSGAVQMKGCKWRALLAAVMVVGVFGCTESGSGGEWDLEIDAADAVDDAGADAGADADETPDAAADVDSDADNDSDRDVAPQCSEDMCGVCDTDPTNDCVQDCAGDWGGAAVVDRCGVCDADPSNDCIADCAGEWGGSAVPDNCGVCDTDPTNDCVQDCAGTYGGDAVEDMCGVCDADPSNDCDCAGTPGGSATTDMCGVCDADPTNDCVQDCAGDWGGSATLDGCGTCDADPSNDCVDDCNGVPGGPAELDMCGVCDEDPANDCVQDCAGNWGGAAVADQCGVCDADPSNDCVQDCAGTWGGAAVVDQCGVCDADPSNDCVQDCAGDWGGSAAVDLCGRCAGGTTGVTACPTLELSPVADASVSQDDAQVNFGNEQYFEVGAELAVNGNPADQAVRAFLRFDLSGLPQDAVVLGVKLQAMAYDGHAYGNDGNVYTQFVADDAWVEDAITWDNQPAADAARLGHWWLWYDFTPHNQLGVNQSSALVPVVQREALGDDLISFRLSSPGYDTLYRSREYSDATQHPKLTIGYLPSTTVSLTPSADTYIRDTSSGRSMNYGTSDELRLYHGGDDALYLRFDLSSLPAGAQVVGARLTMTAFTGFAYGGDGNVYTRLVTDDSWVETGINALNAPAAQQDYLGYWWLWYGFNDNRTRAGTFSSDALRDAVQLEFSGDGQISFRLNSPGYRTYYRSREYSNVAERPALTIEYVVP